jgi:hypothetical protein
MKLLAIALAAALNGQAAMATSFSWIITKGNSCEHYTESKDPFFTPEKLIRLYEGCYIEPSATPKLIWINCIGTDLSASFLYATNKVDCEKAAAAGKRH